VILLSFIGLFLALAAYASLTSRFLRNLALLLVMPHMISMMGYFGGTEAMHVSRFMMLLFVLIGNTIVWTYFMSIADERSD
jgi:hypothetical protein